MSNNTITITYDDDGKRTVERNKGWTGCKKGKYSWNEPHEFRVVSLDLEASSSFKSGFHFRVWLKCKNCGLEVTGDIPTDKFFLHREKGEDENLEGDFVIKGGSWSEDGGLTWEQDDTTNEMRGE